MIWGVLHGGVTEKPSYDHLEQMYFTFVVPLKAKTIILITQSILDLFFTCPNNNHDFDYKYSFANTVRIKKRLGQTKFLRVNIKALFQCL